MNVYEVCVFEMNYDIDDYVCVAKFWVSSSVAVILLDFYQNLEPRMICAFIHHGIFIH